MAFGVLMTLVLTALASCVSGHLSPRSVALPGRVARVDVVAAPDLPADRLERYRELSGDRVIRESIERELRSAGLWEPGGDTSIAVTVTAFRLRSAASAFWFGWWAGSDELEGRIDVRRSSGGRQEVGFFFTSNEELWFKLGSGWRFRGLANALAREIRGHGDAGEP